MWATRPFVLAALAIAELACASPQTNPEETNAPAPATSVERRYLLERVDDAAVVQLYADGFETLPVRDKTLIWHLYQAALAGRDIFYDQRYAPSLEMRAIVEAVVSHREVVDPATFAEVHRYGKLFWLNNGPHNNLTARKFVLGCTPAALADAVKAAVKAGAQLPLRDGESVDALLSRLQPKFFDPAVDAIVTNRSPGPGKDILSASANNLYVGVTASDLKGFNERYGLNSRVVKEGGRLREEVYRVGGRYDREIRAVVTHLEEAMPFATEPMARALEALINFYRTGEKTDRERYDIAWLADKSSPVDTINGFIETYMDARGIKGSWEALVYYVNPKKTETIAKLAANAQWFEDRMPWDPKYRKPDVKGITATAIDVIIETGEAGPVSPVGINLPNDQAIRERYGSKSVSLSNINESHERSTSDEFRSEFSWTMEESARSTRWGSMVSELHTNMHEVIGHASGRAAASLKDTPQQALREYFSAIEEARADLVALYFMPDPKLAELGLIPRENQAEIVEAEYESYTRQALIQLRRVREGSQIEQAHLRNRQMVVRWLIANTSAIEVRTRDNKTYYIMVDAGAFRDGIGRLLAEVQRVKSEGDYPSAKTLFDTYGVHFDPKLRDEIVARVDALNLPSYTGFVMPKLEPVRDAQGRITDVVISYPQDLTKQMLEYSGAIASTPAPLATR
jgi:dipeptidyl-peptidase-3